MSRTRFVQTWLGLGVALCLSTLGCQTHRDQLQRGQGYYEQNQYEQALALFRHMEDDQDALEPVERVRYCYLRGMTDYRLEYKADARYWLGLSRAASKKAESALDAEEVERLDKALEELSAELYKGKGADVQPTPAAAAGAGKCQWSSECGAGMICQDGTCVAIE